jgi:hypothetical protein
VFGDLNEPGFSGGLTVTPTKGKVRVKTPPQQHHNKNRALAVHCRRIIVRFWKGRKSSTGEELLEFLDA